MKIWILFALLLIRFLVVAQNTFDEKKISNATKRIVNKIVKGGAVMSEAIGYEGTRPKQYDNFEALQKNATIQELIVLTDHQSPTVKCYAFWALSHRQNIDLFPIVLGHIKDTAEVSTLFGCIGSAEQVGDFLSM